MNLFVVAGSRGNPGPTAYTIKLENNGRTVLTHTEYFPLLTANQAVFAGVIRGLQETIRVGADYVRVFSNLKLLVDAINGAVEVKHPDLQKLLLQAKELAGRIGSVSALQSRIEPKLKRLADKALDAALAAAA